MDKQDLQKNVHKLQELIRDIDIAMMTTQGEDGALHSRPMATPLKAFDGTLWFFTQAGAAKVEELHTHQQVNLSYTNPQTGRYISISGKAYLEHDRSKIRELWDARFEKWLPGGIDNPNLALLRVKVSQAEYWDAQSAAQGTVIHF